MGSELRLRPRRENFGLYGFLAHSLVGYKEDTCAENRKHTDDYEDHCADAAGFGKDCAGGVCNLSCERKTVGCVHSYRVSVYRRRLCYGALAVFCFCYNHCNIFCKRIEAFGSFGFLKGVCAGFESVEGSRAFCIRYNFRSVCFCVNPRNSFCRFIILIVLCCVVNRLLKNEFCTGKLFGFITGFVFVDVNVEAVKINMVFRISSNSLR